MDRQAFDALVARIELRARSAPAAYQRNLLLLAALGYGYLALLIAILLAILAGAIASLFVLKALAIKIAIAVGAFIWMVLRALWVRIPEPEGVAVTPREAPQLFARIDALREAVGAPRFHRVLITDDFNAAVVQVPRLGLFGWHRNFLLLGLPLMKALSTEQLEAVIAHEFGHLAGGHARLGNWIYRLRAGWSRLHEAMTQQQHWGSFAIRPFFDWYAPYFAAYSFPLARMNEYEADAASARATSPRAASEALTAVNVVGAWLQERFWPGVFARVRDEPRPAFAPFSALSADLGQAIAAPDAARWLERALARKTSSDDTHPALADRLRALGAQAQLSAPVRVSAAQALLGSALAAVEQDFDQRWSIRVTHDWERRHREIHQALAHLADLDRRAADDGADLSDDEILERAQLTAEHGAGTLAAIEQLTPFCERSPRNAGARFVLGRFLLGRDAVAASAHLEAAIALDPDAEAPACSLLFEHFERAGDADEARRWLARWEAATERDHRYRAERSGFSISDKIDPHGLDAARVRELATALRGLGARRAWLVRKRVVQFPERPLYVLGFSATPWWRLKRDEQLAAIQRRIIDSGALPGDTVVAHIEGDHYRIGRKLRWRRGSRIL
jgi:Zn-dependent protease with chaperone function